jgi:hypothetical protein
MAALVAMMLRRKKRLVPKSRKKGAGLRKRKAKGVEVPVALQAFALAETTLHGPGDPREAIMVCYRRLLAELARRGLVRPDAATPREWMAQVEGSLPLRALSPLTALFEHAAYSDLPVTEAHRSRAAALLGAARAELKRMQAPVPVHASAEECPPPTAPQE